MVLIITISQTVIRRGQNRSQEVPDHEQRKAQEQSQSSTELRNEREGVVDELLGLLDDLVVGVDEKKSHTISWDGDHLADHPVLVELAGGQTLDKTDSKEMSGQGILSLGELTQLAPGVGRQPPAELQMVPAQYPGVRHSPLH